MNADSSKPESAMRLSEQEWVDLAVMASHYRSAMAWVDAPGCKTEAEVGDIRRRRKLAFRIRQAVDLG